MALYRYKNSEIDTATIAAYQAGKPLRQRYNQARRNKDNRVLIDIMKQVIAHHKKSPFEQWQSDLENVWVRLEALITRPILLSDVPIDQQLKIERLKTYWAFQRRYLTHSSTQLLFCHQQLIKLIPVYEAAQEEYQDMRRLLPDDIQNAYGESLKQGLLALQTELSHLEQVMAFRIQHAPWGRELVDNNIQALCADLAENGIKINLAANYSLQPTMSLTTWYTLCHTLQTSPHADLKAIAIKTLNRFTHGTIPLVSRTITTQDSAQTIYLPTQLAAQIPLKPKWPAFIYKAHNLRYDLFEQISLPLMQINEALALVKNGPLPVNQLTRVDQALETSAALAEMAFVQQQTLLGWRERFHVHSLSLLTEWQQLLAVQSSTLLLAKVDQFDKQLTAPRSIETLNNHHPLWTKEQAQAYEIRYNTVKRQLAAFMTQSRPLFARGPTDQSILALQHRWRLTEMYYIEQRRDNQHREQAQQHHQEHLATMAKAQQAELVKQRLQAFKDLQTPETTIAANWLIEHYQGLSVSEQVTLTKEHRDDVYGLMAFLKSRVEAALILLKEREPAELIRQILTPIPTILSVIRELGYAWPQQFAASAKAYRHALEGIAPEDVAQWPSLTAIEAAFAVLLPQDDAFESSIKWHRMARRSEAGLVNLYHSLFLSNPMPAPTEATIATTEATTATNEVTTSRDQAVQAGAVDAQQLPNSSSENMKEELIEPRQRRRHSGTATKSLLDSADNLIKNTQNNLEGGAARHASTNALLNSADKKLAESLRRYPNVPSTNDQPEQAEEVADFHPSPS